MLNFSDIFFEALVSSTLSLNFTETDSISISGNSFRSNVNTKVESMPELNEIPIFFELESILLEIDFLIDCSIISSQFFIVVLMVKSSGLSFLEIFSRFTE